MFKSQPWAPMNVTLCGNWVLADVINEDEVIPAQGGPKSHMAGASLRREGETQGDTGRAPGEKESRDGATHLETKEGRYLQESTRAWKSSGRTHPERLQRGHSPADTLTLDSRPPKL